MFESGKAKFALAVLLLSGASTASDLTLTNLGGGRLSAPVSRGAYLYAAMGVTINVWDFSTPAAPLLASRTTAQSAPGPICGLVIVGDYLYACWKDINWTGGISIYSLSDPSRPTRVAEIDGYPADFIAAAGNYVYLAGSSSAVVSLDARDPLHPVQVGEGNGLVPPSIYSFALQDGKLLLSGANFLGNPMFLVFDLADPAHPDSAGLFLDTIGPRGLAFDDDYLISASGQLNVYDFRNPPNFALVFSENITFATHALVDGDALYLFGGTEAQVWNFMSPAHPAFLRSVPIDTSTTEQVSLTSLGPLVLTARDTGILFDDSPPYTPSVMSMFTLPVGASVPAGAVDDRYAYLAEAEYGLSIVRLLDFESMGRFDACAVDYDETTVCGARDIALHDGLAYVLSPSGIVAVDIGEPTHPIEAGRIALPYFDHMAVDGTRAYLTARNQHTNLAIVDISDVGNMRLLGTLGGFTPLDVAVRGNHVFVAVEGGWEPAGLRIVDVSNASAPAIVGLYTGCDLSQGNGVDVSGDGRTTYLGCSDGSLRILDTGDVTAPTLIGIYNVPDAFNAIVSVIVSGDTAYVGHAFGVDEIDVSIPTMPTQRARYPTSWVAESLALSPNGSLLAFAGVAGTYLFSSPRRTRGHSFHARPPSRAAGE